MNSGISSNGLLWNVLFVANAIIIASASSGSVVFICLVTGPLVLLGFEFLAHGQKWFGGPLTGHPWALLVPLLVALAWYAVSPSVSLLRGWALIGLLLLVCKLEALRTKTSEPAQQATE